MNIEKELSKFSKEAIIKAALMSNPFTEKYLLRELMRFELDLILQKKKELSRKIKDVNPSDGIRKVVEIVEYNENIYKSLERLHTKYMSISEKLCGK